MSWLTRLRNTFDPRRLDRDLAEELRDHLDRRTADLEASGLTPAEARRQAALRFGNTARLREQSREIRLWSTLDDTRQDLRYASRGLLRNPVFAITTVLSLGLAIGAITAIYSIVEAAMLRPLPLSQRDRLFLLSSDASGTFSYPLYEQLRTAAAHTAGLALFDTPNRVDVQAGGLDAPYEQAVQQYISADAFEVLDIPSALGQLFGDARPGATPAPVLLSNEYWQRRFAGNPSVLGMRFSVNGRICAIVGVARQGFSGVEAGKFVDFWLPITSSDPGILTNAEFQPFQLLGRLAPGTTRQQLASRLQPAFHDHQESRSGARNGRPTLQVNPGAHGVSAFRQTFARPLWILLGVASCILLIACANVASLLLARSTARGRELSLRVSLGASRARVMRQLFTESLLIAMLACFGGWVLARLAAPALVAIVSNTGDPIRLDLAPNLPVLSFCAAICGLSTLFFGWLPALQATGTRVVTGRLRLGQLFVGIQVAFAFCLVASGTGFLFSLRNLAAVDTGFDPHGVTVLTVSNNLGPGERARQLTLLREMQMRTAALPRVQGAATGWMALFSGSRRADRVVLPGKPPSDRAETFYRVSPGYFATLRTPLLAGRDFVTRDNDDEPVATIVNVAFAKRYFGSESVLWREFRRDDGVRHQIVGLAANSHFGSLRTGPEPIAYMPMKPPRAFTLYVRSTLDAASVTRMVEREANALGSGTRVTSVTTLDALVGSTIIREKLLAGIGGAFALLGLALAAIGVFGLLNYSVARRTREIGIRTALGAPRLQLFVLVMKDSMGLLVAGLAIGLVGSLSLMRFARSLLFGITPADPRVMGAALAIFLAAAAVAASLPARRAAAIDPMAALRHD